MTRYRWRVKVLPAILDVIVKVVLYGVLGLAALLVVALVAALIFDAAHRAILIFAVIGLGVFFVAIASWFAPSGRIDKDGRIFLFGHWRNR